MKSRALIRRNVERQRQRGGQRGPRELVETRYVALDPERARDEIRVAARDVALIELEEDDAGALEGSTPISTFGERIVTASVEAEGDGARVELAVDEVPRPERQVLAIVLLALAVLTVVPLLIYVIARPSTSTRRDRQNAVLDGLWKRLGAAPR